MSVAFKFARPLVAAEISRLTFIPANLLRPDDKLSRIGINKALKTALGDSLKASLQSSQIDIDLKVFGKRASTAKTIDDLVRATARSSRSIVPGGAKLAALTNTALQTEPDPISRPTARAAVVASMKKQLSWQGLIKDADKLSKWKYTPIMRAQLAALINNYFRNGIAETSLELVPPMALSHISAATYVSDVVDAVDEKQTRPRK